VSDHFHEGRHSSDLPQAEAAIPSVAVTIAVLGGAALLATLLPAIRAATIAPVIVLQQE
jgi:ABC-type lipoprotein release transport system permease subunit